MKHDELKVQAQALGITDIESYSYNDLKKKVSTVQKEKEPSEQEENAAQQNSTPPTYYEDSDGKKYRFSAQAPPSFRFNGVIKTQEEWLQDQEAMEQLALGNSRCIEQIF